MGKDTIIRFTKKFQQFFDYTKFQGNFSLTIKRGEVSLCIEYNII